MSGMVGAYLNESEMSVSSLSAAQTLWTGWTGRPLGVTRMYQAASTFTYTTDMAYAASAGIKVCLTLRPAYNPVSSTDLTNLGTLLSTMQAAGLQADITLWHEPYYSGLTSAQYIAMVAYYGPTVRTYYPLVFCTSAASVDNNSENTYYPGDANVDKVATDLYCYSWLPGGGSSTLNLAASIADNAVPPKPFGVWEFNGSTDVSVGQTQAQVTAYYAYVQAYMAERRVQGKTNADVLLFNSGAAGNDMTTVITSGSDYRIALYDVLYDALGVSSPVVANVWNVTAAGEYTYGTQQITLNAANNIGGGSGTPTAGNWLILTASWKISQDQAVVYAADDAHNFWQPVLCTTDPTSILRTAVLAVQNSRLCTTVSVASTAFIRDATYTVVEVENMGAGYVIDTTASSVASSGDTFTLTAGTVSQPDFVIAVGVQLALASITVNAGWTSEISSEGSFTSSQTAWQYVTSGAPSITFTNGVSASSNWAGIMVAFVANEAPPQNPNPAWPVLQCEAAFGYAPGVPTVYPVWTDISARFLGIEGSRGRQFELDQLEAADVTITLDNNDGAFNPFNTGGAYYPNVQLITPIRLLATWQGRTYQVFNGHLEYDPQTVEEMYGIVKTQCSDAFSKLPQVSLQSCMLQEQLYDQPLHLWPLTDPAGSTFASNDSGRSNDILSKVQSKYGSGPISANFGVAAEFAGEESTTCWSTSGYNNTVALDTGTTLRLDSDNFPTMGNTFTIEFWAKIQLQANQNASFIGQYCSILSINDMDFLSGQGFIWDFAFIPYSSGTQITWTDSTGTYQQVYPANNLLDGDWHHHAFTFSATNWSWYLDGSRVTGSTTSYARNFPDQFCLGGVANRFWVGNFGGMSFSHVAVYDRIIDPERIAIHYHSGADGFRLESTGSRIARLLTYANWGQAQALDSGQNITQELNYLDSGGYGASGIGGGTGIYGSYGTTGSSGTQCDQAVVDVASSENGLLVVDQNGTIIFKQRSNLYNAPNRGAFGDTFVPLNQNPYFGRGISPWGATNGTASWSQGVWGVGSLTSILLTPNGTGSGPRLTSEEFAVKPSTNYTAQATVFSPQGWIGIQIFINWFDSTHTIISTSTQTAVNLPPNTPIALTYSNLTSPSNAAYAQHHVQLAGTPASSVLLYVDDAPFSATGILVPYMDDIDISYDVTYLYNDVTITRNYDQAYARVKNAPSAQAYFPRTYQRTIYTYYDSPPVEVIDCANWLINAYSQPQLRVANMTIDAATNVDAWAACLSLDIGDIVAFRRTPPGAAAPIFEGLQIISVNPTIGQDTATFAYVLAPVLNPVLTLNDPIFGLLGSNYLGW